jgi:sec-independent protein translocase protein TatC
MPETPNAIPSPGDEEMSVWEHLEDLRKAVIWAVLGVIAGAIVCAIFGDWILDTVLLSPTRQTKPPMVITNTKVYGQLSVYMQVVLWGGVILSFPNTLLQVWKFVAPGLKDKEKKYVFQITAFTILSFLAGMAFAYFIMLPMVLDFAVGDILPGVKNLIEIQDYLSIFLEIVIISGLVFELPLIAYFLGRMGILTPPLLRHYRRHAIIALLAIAALLSPGGNPILQLVLFVPLWALFELSILATSLAARQRKLAELAALS